MKPGEVAGVVQSIPTKPKKNYGAPGAAFVQAQNTVIMAPEDNAQLADAKAMIAAASQHPVSQNAQPPEIELVQHSIPSDAPADPRLILLARPDSEQAAAFRVLRHHVLDMGHPQVIAVSGPLDGCGKTTVAINLAMALAECGRAEVLLVDANLRNPKLASILRYVPPWCFAEQLHAHRTQPFSPWRFVDIQQIGLHVAAIDPRNERNQRLDAPAFAIAMDRLRLGPYQHIVVDCPSVIGNADVNLIQDSTDGVLLAARTKQVTARDIRNAVDQLTPTKILGTALFET
jgi:Mrp family chromosome partitioning ATPase